MKPFAALFPGQGAQKVGMGSCLYATHAEARRVFHDVQDAYGSAFIAAMLHGPEDDLQKTHMAQPALFALSMALVAVMQDVYGVTMKQFSWAAGHSLGEYAALCATGVMSLETTARVLRLRADAMAEANKARPGGMVALVGWTVEQVRACLSALPGDTFCVVANDNAPQQVVVSGDEEGLRRAVDYAQRQGVKRCVRLAVAGAFHSPAMAQAQEIVAEHLENTAFFPPCVPVVTNISGQPQTDPAVLKDHLIRQVAGSVLWRASLEAMASRGVVHFAEIGAGTVLCGLVRRVVPGAPSFSLETPQDVHEFSTQWHLADLERRGGADGEALLPGYAASSLGHAVNGT